MLTPVFQSIILINTELSNLVMLESGSLQNIFPLRMFEVNSLGYCVIAVHGPF